MADADAFVHDEVECRVVFGPGSRWRVAEELDRLGVQRAAFISGQRSSEMAHALAETCNERAAALLPHATMHVPTELAERTARTVADLGADGLVAVGGGSAVGLAKAVARRQGSVILAVPTSYAGSEMTPIWGETCDGAKATGRSPEVRPRTVLYDVELTVSLPAPFTVTSAMNAIAHAVEGLYAPDASPIRRVVAEEGIRKALTALPHAVAGPECTRARGELLEAAWMCATVLGSTTMGLHHKLCHLLGGTLNLPHAEAHTVLLPHVMAYNLLPGGDARARAARAVGHPNPAQELWRRVGSMGGPRSLQELGMARPDVTVIVEQAMAGAFTNPRAVGSDELFDLLSRALVGEEPVETWA